MLEKSRMNKVLHEYEAEHLMLDESPMTTVSSSSSEEETQQYRSPPSRVVVVAVHAHGFQHTEAGREMGHSAA